MTGDQKAGGLGTAAGDYGRDYYTGAPVGGYDHYGWETKHWREFFTMVADRIVGLAEPATALDVGCATGMLVQALRYRGVDARGFDMSEYAVKSAHEDVRDHLWVGSATEPITGRYDLVTCVEVLEHMSPEDAQKAIDSMCSVTDRILFSSSPGHFEEPTHINTHPTSQWAAWFAERGFYRDPGADATFLASWAVLFERAEVSRSNLVERYERLVVPLQQEVADKRRALLEAHRQLSTRPAGPSVNVKDKELLARHAELTAVDHVIGLEARIAVLEQELRELTARNRKLRSRLEEAAPVSRSPLRRAARIARRLAARARS